MAHPSPTEREDKKGKVKRSLEVTMKGENKISEPKKKTTASEQSLVSEKTKKL